MIRIVLAEDHAVVREGFRRILEEAPDVSVVAETGDGLEAVRLVEEHRPDVLILDLKMPGLHGLEVVRRVEAEWPSVNVVVLSRHADESYVAEALRGGAEAYVLKDSAAEELTRAVRKVLGGGSATSPRRSRRRGSTRISRTRGKTRSGPIPTAASPHASGRSSS